MQRGVRWLALLIFIVSSIGAFACVNLTDPLTYGGDVVNISNSTYFVNNNISLCTGTYTTDTLFNYIIINGSYTLDCNGSTLIGGGLGTGILGTQNNTGVDNCTIEGFGTGVSIFSFNDSAVPFVEYNWTTDPSGLNDRLYSLTIDQEGNIIAGGYDLLAGGPQFRVMKLTSQGKIIWNWTSPIFSGDDRIRSMAVDTEGNVIVGGDSFVVAGVYNWTVFKIDNQGNTVWNWTQNVSSDLTSFSDLTLDSNNNIIVGGWDKLSGFRQMRVVKISSAGNTLWNWTVPSAFQDSVTSVVIDQQGIILAAGYLGSTINWTLFAIDGNGNNLWNYSRNMGGGMVNALDVDSSGNIILAGYESTPGDAEWTILKISPTRVHLWNWTQNPSGGTDDIKSIVIDQENNIIAGGIDDSQANTQWRIVKINTTGNTLWNWTQNPSVNTDELWSVAINQEGSIVAGGYERDPVNFDKWRIVKLSQPKQQLNSIVDTLKFYNTNLTTFISLLNSTGTFSSIEVGYNSTIGKIEIPSLSTGDNYLSTAYSIFKPDFVSINSTATINESANITIDSGLGRCLGLSFYKKTGFPQNKTDIITNGVSYTPSYYFCNNGIVTFSTLNGFSGYATGSQGNIVMVLSKISSPNPINLSDTTLLNYTVTVTVGSGTAYNVTINETYPNNVTFVSANPALTIANDTWIIGNLTSGQSYEVNITVNVSTSLPDGTTITNNVSAFYVNYTGSTLSVQTTQDTAILNPSAVGCLDLFDVTTYAGRAVLVSGKNIIINNDVKLCKKNYSTATTQNFVIVNGSYSIDCNNSRLIGSGLGTGILGKTMLNVSNCKIINFGAGIASFPEGSTPPLYDWNVTEVDDPGNDKIHGIAIDNEGNRIMAGERNGDWRIGKFDRDGNAIWTQTIAWSANYDAAYDVDVDQDGNYIFVGEDRINGAGDSQWRSLKTNSDGIELWNVSINTWAMNDGAKGIAVDQNGNYVIVGNNATNWGIIRLNDDGSVNWTKNQLWTANSDFARNVIIDQNNDILVAGDDQPGIAWNEWRILKLSINGSELWNYSQDPNPGNTDIAYGLTVDHEGNYAVAGYDSSDGAGQWRVIKLSSAGSLLWNWTQNFSASQDIAYDIVTDLDGNYIAVGKVDNGDDEFRAVKISTNGTTMWNYTLDVSGNDDEANAANIDPFAELVMGGYLTTGAGTRNLILINLLNKGPQNNHYLTDIEVQKTNYSTFLAFRNQTLNAQNLVLAYNDTVGRIDYPTVSGTTVGGLTTYNLRIQKDFVSINSSNTLADQLNTTANITIETGTGDCNISYVKAQGYQANRSSILNTGLTFTPSFSTCAGGIATFQTQNAFSGYATNNNALVCGQDITTNVTLTQDINCSGSAFNITFGGVGVDCKGHTVRFDTSDNGNYHAFFVRADNVEIKNCVIIDNTTIGSNNTGIRVAGDFALIDNNTIILDGAGQMYGIMGMGLSTKTTKNNITINSTANYNSGIQINGTNTNASKNIINLLVMSYSEGINLIGTGFTVLDNNLTIVSNGADGRTTGIKTQGTNGVINNNQQDVYGVGEQIKGIVAGNSNGTLIEDNTVTTDGLNARNYGIELLNSCDDIKILNNVLWTNGTSDEYGITGSNCDNVTVSNNNVTTQGSATKNYGIVFSGLTNAKLIDNKITTDATLSDAIRILGSSDGNNLTGNILNTLQSNSFGLLIFGNATAQNNLFNNTAQWISLTTANVSFLNTTFQTTNGSIQLPSNFVLNGTKTVTRALLKVFSNRAFLNSSALTEMNTTGRITLFSVPTANPYPIVDFDNDGIFTPCNLPQCVVVSSTPFGTFIYDVLHFTSYSSTDGNMNVTLNKTDTPDPVASGGLVNYTITIQVDAGDPKNMTLVETYPPNMTYVNSTLAPTSGNNTWNLGNRTTGDVIQFTITLQVDPGLITQVVNNTINISYNNISGDLIDFGVTENTTILGQTPANIILTKTDNPDPVNSGSNLNYTITINVTDNNASNVTITETYPAGTVFVNASPAPSAGNNVWNLGNLSNGTVTTINITLFVPAAMSGVITNNVTAEYKFSGEELMRTTSENTTVNNQQPAAITFTKTAPGTVTPGGSMTYTITVTNNGNGTAFNTTLVETYPSNTQYASSSVPPSIANTTWNLGNLTPGQTVQVQIIVSNNASIGDTLQNNVTLTFTNSTGGAESDNATASTTVRRRTPTSTGGGGGGGGGGARTFGQTYLMNNDPGTLVLKKGDKLQMLVKNEQHSLFINNIFASSVMLTVSSTPRTYTLVDGTSTPLDVDGDLIADIIVEINYITRGEVSLTVRTLKQQQGFMMNYDYDYDSTPELIDEQIEELNISDESKEEDKSISEEVKEKTVEQKVKDEMDKGKTKKIRIAVLSAITLALLLVIVLIYSPKKKDKVFGRKVIKHRSHRHK